MQIVAEEDIKRVISVEGCRQAVASAFEALSNGSVLAPDEFAMKLDNGGELHIKGAYLGAEFIAFKVASGGFPVPGNHGFTSVLDATTGRPVAILQDGGWLTEMRTAAASAVTAQLLARSDSSRLAILGAGIQAAFQVDAMRHALPIDEVIVWSRTEERSHQFAQDHGAVPAASPGDAVAKADIVVCCTPSRSPILSAEMLRPGTHVIAMGADMVGKRELADSVLRQADRIVCDSVETGSRVGELQHVPELVATPWILATCSPVGHQAEPAMLSSPLLTSAVWAYRTRRLRRWCSPSLACSSHAGSAVSAS